jgi:hypothetical protein
MSLPSNPEEIGRDIGESFNKLSYPKLFFAIFFGASLSTGIGIIYYLF